MSEIVTKARVTSQHNLKSKTQFKLGFRVLFYVFLVIKFKNMQGIHSANKQQLNHIHITDKDVQYITNIQQRNYAVVHTLKDKHYQKKTSTSNEITI